MMSQKQTGFTLLEVLVAIIVLSVGLLGLAGLMATSMRNNHSAYQRTQAAWLAYDVVDRMRVNRKDALINDYDVPIGSATIATPSTLANADINGWKTTLANSLPVGDGSVAVTVNAAGVASVTVIVQWDDTRGTGGVSTQPFRVDTQL
jgi:type IV pilus assembly protein PilV